MVNSNYFFDVYSQIGQGSSELTLIRFTVVSSMHKKIWSKLGVKILIAIADLPTEYMCTTSLVAIPPFLFFLVGARKCDIFYYIIVISDGDNIIMNVGWYASIYQK